MFLPASWDAASAEAGPDKVARRRACGIPAELGHVEKWQLALDMIDETRSWGVHVPLVIADAGYGDTAAFRLGLQERGLHCMVGISATPTAHPARDRPVTPAYSGTGRPPVAKYPDRARSVKELGSVAKVLVAVINEWL